MNESQFVTSCHAFEGSILTNLTYNLTLIYERVLSVLGVLICKSQLPIVI